MGRYPAQPLEEKEAWMRERQAKRQEKEAQPVAVERQRPGSVQLPQMLRVPQVARALGVSAPTVQNWFRRRAVIVRTRRKSIMLIPQRALDDWISEHTNSRGG
jgi:DNA-binding transcriptional regulator YiaG